MRNSFAILLVSTGPFANAILEYSNRLLGTSKSCHALELREEDHWKDALVQVEESVVGLKDFDGVLVLVEVMGGTPYNIAKHLRKRHNVEVIGGVNLPMVIKALQISEKMSVREAAEYLEEYGRKHILRCSEKAP